MIGRSVVPRRYPYCGVGCTLELHLGMISSTGPSPSVASQSQELCVKGGSVTTIYRNVIRPLPSAQAAAGPGFDRKTEVSWDEALDYVADRLTAIYQRDGSDAMAVYCCAKATNEDNYLLQKMYRSLFRTNNIDHCTRLCHAGSVIALQQAVGSSAMSNTASQVLQNDVFIVPAPIPARTRSSRQMKGN
jgi:predicted molibdopterin-dependent oxidoreductase YjgC